MQCSITALILDSHNYRTHITPTLTKHHKTSVRLVKLQNITVIWEFYSSLFGAISYTHYTCAFPPNSAIIFNLKNLSIFFNATFYLLLKLRRFLNVNHLFIWVLACFPAPWIFTSTHNVDLGIQKAMGSLRGSAATESKIIAGEQID